MYEIELLKNTPFLYEEIKGVTFTTCTYIVHIHLYYVC